MLKRFFTLVGFLCVGSINPFFVKKVVLKSPQGGIVTFLGDVHLGEPSIDEYQATTLFNELKSAQEKPRILFEGCLPLTCSPFSSEAKRERLKDPLVRHQKKTDILFNLIDKKLDHERIPYTYLSKECFERNEIINFIKTIFYEIPSLIANATHYEQYHAVYGTLRAYTHASIANLSLRAFCHRYKASLRGNIRRISQLEKMATSKGKISAILYEEISHALRSHTSILQSFEEKNIERLLTSISASNPDELFIDVFFRLLWEKRFSRVPLEENYFEGVLSIVHP